MNGVATAVTTARQKPVQPATFQSKATMLSIILLVVGTLALFIMSLVIRLISDMIREHKEDKYY